MYLRIFAQTDIRRLPDGRSAIGFCSKGLGGTVYDSLVEPILIKILTPVIRALIRYDRASAAAAPPGDVTSAVAAAASPGDVSPASVMPLTQVARSFLLFGILLSRVSRGGCAR